MANIVWSLTGTPAGSGRSVKGVATSGTATFDAAANDGCGLDTVGAVFVVVEADAGKTLSGAGTLLCYHLNSVSGNWARAADWDLTVPSGASGNRAAVLRGPSTGFGIPVPCARDRLAFAPSSVTLSGGGLTIYINCSRWQALAGDGSAL